MATRSKKKPVKRKAQAASSGRSLTTFGWIAAGIVGCAWAASDGRPVRYASNAMNDVRQMIRPDHAIDGVAALIRSEPKPRMAASTPIIQPRERFASLPEERTGSIRPTPRPMSEIRKPEAAAIPLPAKAPLLPLAAPTIDDAFRQPRAMPLPATSVPVGEERHATRALAIHAAPNASSPSATEVSSGSPVVVLRGAGDWRYVHDKRNGAEGWVDGRFLAGQSMASDLAVLSRGDLTRGR